MSHENSICCTEVFVFTSKSHYSKGTQQPGRVVGCGATTNGYGWMQTAAGDLWVSQCDPKALSSVTVFLLKPSGLSLHKWARTQWSGLNQKRLQGSSLFSRAGLILVPEGASQLWLCSCRYCSHPSDVLTASPQWELLQRVLPVTSMCPNLILCKYSATIKYSSWQHREIYAVNISVLWNNLLGKKHTEEEQQQEK